MMVKAKLIPALLLLVTPKRNAYIAGTAAKNIGILCQRNEDASEIALDAGAVHVLLPVALKVPSAADLRKEPESPYIQSNAIHALLSMCAGGCEAKHAICEAKSTLPSLLAVMRCPHEETQAEAMLLLHQLCRCDHMSADVLKADVLVELVRLLAASNGKPRLRARLVESLRDLGSIEYGRYTSQMTKALFALEKRLGEACALGLAREVGLGSELKQVRSLAETVRSLEESAARAEEGSNSGGGGGGGDAGGSDGDAVDGGKAAQEEELKKHLPPGATSVEEVLAMAMDVVGAGQSEDDGHQCAACGVQGSREIKQSCASALRAS